jgi:hypothetical protein
MRSTTSRPAQTIRRRQQSKYVPELAGVAELADALDSKSSDRKIVWVRAPPPAMLTGFLVSAQINDRHADFFWRLFLCETTTTTMFSREREERPRGGRRTA